MCVPKTFGVPLQAPSDTHDEAVLASIEEGDAAVRRAIEDASNNAGSPISGHIASSRQALVILTACCFRMQSSPQRLSALPAVGVAHDVFNCCSTVMSRQEDPMI
jgi:hypothetical protein